MKKSGKTKKIRRRSQASHHSTNSPEYKRAAEEIKRSARRYEEAARELAAASNT